VQEFQLISDYKPCGDQTDAIESLVQSFSGESADSEKRSEILLGVTGSGKTFTMANVIQQLGRPTLVLSHNKTLAAQLYGELKGFFPANAVEYFISYYDYYQPEAYLPSSDTFIEKDSSINEEIDRLRLRATCSLFERRDVIIVASVSAIYGLGNPREFRKGMIELQLGQEIDRNKLLHRMVDSHYVRAAADFERGTFRVNGDVIEIHPAYEETAIRIETFGDEIEKISVIDPLSGTVISTKPTVLIYPAKQFVTSAPRLEGAIKTINEELEIVLERMKHKGKSLEAHRLRQRTRFDLEMLQEVGFCSGIENYSRHLDGRLAGSRPHCLMDYFPDDILVVVDESHATLPQVRAMYQGDRVRKDNLVDYGFRLPSALDNRPLQFSEFQDLAQDIIYLSATPGDYELECTEGEYVEQLIRPTGLLDPPIIVRGSMDQMQDLLSEIETRSARDERVLVTTLTKRMAEDLSKWLGARGIKVQYLHSDVDAMRRVELLRDLRLGEYDVLVGVNLLREGLDLPEVSMVAVLDADKEGFLRSVRSLFQIVGRAARNVNGRVVFYADRISNAMQIVIDETKRRRLIQEEFNTQHGIEPRTIRKSHKDIMATTSVLDEARSIKNYQKAAAAGKSKVAENNGAYVSPDQQIADVGSLRDLMEAASARLDFELAAKYRDQLKEMGELDSEKNSTVNNISTAPGRAERKNRSRSMAARKKKMLLRSKVS
jgi:excinuclease ABC subunit B